MITDIENGKVNPIIIKDLSRFGREYTEMGMIIKQYFESKNTRFITVQNNIDSINGIDNILLPITNVMNAMYAKKCSIKAKAACAALAKSGKRIGSNLPFKSVRQLQTEMEFFYSRFLYKQFLRLSFGHFENLHKIKIALH